MVTIEIDEEVYTRLQSLAEPFADTPNTVLKRLLFGDSKATKTRPRGDNDTSRSKGMSFYSSPNSRLGGKRVSSGAFMKFFLSSHYMETFCTRSPYRTMFESEKHLVYFQNFNKADTRNLWYRVNKKSVGDLRNSKKVAVVCFTNPSENIVFEIPMKDIDRKAAEAGWNRDYFEVNIDPANCRWRELDWRMEKYLVSVKL